MQLNVFSGACRKVDLLLLTGLLLYESESVVVLLAVMLCWLALCVLRTAHSLYTVGNNALNVELKGNTQLCTG